MMSARGRWRNSKPPTAVMPSGQGARGAASERIEGSYALGCPEIYSHDDDRHDGESRGERNIARRSLLGVDRLADEIARGADDLRNDVVAKRQREGEDRSGDKSGQRQRQDDGAKRLDGVGAEIGRCLNEARGNTLEGRLGGKDHVRKPDIDERQEHADVAYGQRWAA